MAGNNPDSSTGLSTEKPAFAAVVQDLIYRFQTQGGKNELKLDGATEGVSLFVRPDSTCSLPNVGVAIARAGQEQNFTMHFWKNGLPEIPADYVGEAKVERQAPGKGISMSTHVTGVQTLNTEINYGTDIIQAMANVYGTRILHSLTVDRELKDVLAELAKRGYALRTGYTDFYDKIYRPTVQPSQ